MSLVVITAEKTNDAVLVSYDLSTESRFKDDSTTEEEYRAVLRVVVSQEAQNVSDVSPPTDEIYETSLLNVRFNRDSLVTLYPLDSPTEGGSYTFKLINQSFTPYEAKGSTFFSGVKEYVSVTPWGDLAWD